MVSPRGFVLPGPDRTTPGVIPSPGIELIYSSIRPGATRSCPRRRVGFLRIAITAKAVSSDRRDGAAFVISSGPQR